ncbi:MAG TPA: hypothetical protein VMV00_01415 [Candidatus Baltobacteraceae bacterium]|nr:hypothetical protein [Candidatus Baltobacteraceae bacterium]
MYQTKRNTSTDVLKALHKHCRETAVRGIVDLDACVQGLGKVYAKSDENGFSQATKSVKYLAGKMSGTEIVESSNKFASEILLELNSIYDETGGHMPSFISELNIKVNSAMGHIKDDISFVNNIASDEFRALFTVLNASKIPIDESKGIIGDATITMLKAKGSDTRIKDAVDRLVREIMESCKDDDSIDNALVTAEGSRKFLRSAAMLLAAFEKINGDDAKRKEAIKTFLGTDFEGEEPILRAFDKNATVSQRLIDRMNSYLRVLDSHYSMIRRDIRQLDVDSKVTDAISMFLEMNAVWISHSRLPDRERNDLLKKNAELERIVGKNLMENRVVEDIRRLSKEGLERYILSLKIDVSAEIGEHASTLLSDHTRYYGRDKEWIGLYNELYARYEYLRKGGREVALPPPSLV